MTTTPDMNKDLKYGIIYVYGNPKQTHNLQWFATMIAPMIRPLSIEWVMTWDLNHTVIVARRFNVGNIGKYATAQIHLNRYGHSDSFSLLAAVHAFSDCLQDVMDTGVGDVIFRESDYNDRNRLPQGKWGATTSPAPMSDILREYGHGKVMEGDDDRSERDIDEDIPSRRSVPQDHTRVERNHFPNLIDFHRDIMSIDESEEYALEEKPTAGTSAPIGLEAEELVEFRRIETEYERDVKDLRARIVAFIAKYHQDPQQVMTTMLEGKVLLGQSPSRILVNGDMKIVLPEFDEMEIKMPAMCRTLYILFMKRRLQGHDGIVLRNMEECHDEILDIYSLVKPGANEDRVEESVNNLCNPSGESLNQSISRINRCIRNVITDQELVQKYLVKGTRGESYGIELEPDLIELPRAVTFF